MPPALRPSFSSRLSGLCVAQACGALNDNLVKAALVSLAVFRLHAPAATVVALSAALFILPYAALSATAGLLADRFAKSTVLRIAKGAEVALAGVAAYGFARGSVPLLLGVVGGLGVQAAVFSPVKYGILPELLDGDELVRGNGYVEASTFVAILLGTIGGALLVALPHGQTAVATAAVMLAVLGLLAAFFVPATRPAAPGLPVGANLLAATRGVLAHAGADRVIRRCIGFISWFWMVGTILTNEIPLVVRDVLRAGSATQAVLLGVFSVGVGAGSLACGPLLRRRASTALVGPALGGITLFSVLLALTLRHSVGLASGPGALMLGSLGGLAASGGLLSVPLFALLQGRSDARHHARVIAAGNVVNALFMVAGSVFTAVAAWAGWSVAAVIAITGAVNLLVLGAGAATDVRRSALALCRLYFRVFHRVRVAGLDHLAEAGERAVIVANHLSGLDGALLAAFLPGRPVFATDTASARRLRRLRSVVDLLPIDLADPDAVRAAVACVRSGRHLVIFPEGRITVTGALMKIDAAAALIADRADAPVVPVRIDGLQFHRSSRMRGRLRLRWFPRVAMAVLSARRLPVDPEIAGAARRARLLRLLGDAMNEAAFRPDAANRTLFAALLDARARYDTGRAVVADLQPQDDGSMLATELSYRRLVLGAAVLGRAIAPLARPGEAVGVLLPNAAGAAVTFWALQAIGRVAAMLNFTAGPADVVSACRMASIGTVLTSRRFVARAKLEGIVEEAGRVARVVYLEDVRAGLTRGDKLRGLLASLRPRCLPGARLDPDTTASILFTSGSEGAPKGVALTHRNLLANCLQATAIVDIDPTDRLFNAMPMFHGFGLMGGLLLPLFNGIRTFLYPSPLHYREVPEFVGGERSTIMFGTDSFLAGYARTAHPTDFQSLRYIFAGAEKLRPETRDIYMRRFHKPIFEGYGATETSPVLAINTWREARPGTVGRLLPGIEWRLEPIAGVAGGGRLLVRGPNVMRGYLAPGRPGTVEMLADGWYDTGDIVAFDEDGFVLIVGRVKRFAKIAGEMVSMTAGEALAAELWPEAQHAIVAVADPGKGERLVLVSTADVDADRLRRHASDRGVSKLAVPKVVLRRETVPLLGSGKVDYPAVQRLVTEPPNPE